MNLLTSQASQGILKLAMAGSPANGGGPLAAVSMWWDLTILSAASNTTSVQLDVLALFNTSVTLGSSAFADAEAFRAAEYSSSNVDAAHTSLGVRTHDADRLRLFSSNGQTLIDNDLNTAPLNALLFPGGQSFDGWMELDQLQPAPLNGDPPNILVRILPATDTPEYRGQGFITTDAGTDENSDNVGVWANRTFPGTYIAPATNLAWQLLITANDEATLVHTTVADFNLDGKEDLARRNGAGQWLVTTGQGGTEVWGAWSTAVSWYDVRAADTNGDGRTDILGRTGTGAWYAAVSVGNAFVNWYMGAWSPAAAWQDVLAADVNADGADDMVGRTETGAWWAGISTGASFTNQFMGAWAPVTWDDVQMADVDGDNICLLYTSPSPRDQRGSRMPSSA